MGSSSRCGGVCAREEGASSYCEGRIILSVEELNAR